MNHSTIDYLSATLYYIHMSKLVLVRHGLSRWNMQNRFSGWVDMPLAEQGIVEAQRCAKELQQLPIDICFTSELSRAQETMSIILTKQTRTGIFIHDSAKYRSWSIGANQIDGTDEIPIFSTQLLNERYYGALQGMDKDEARRKYGEQNVLTWRRSYDVRPPKGESLKDVYERTVPFFNRVVMKHLKKGKNVVVSAHGNSLRAILKSLESIGDNEIVNLEFFNGRPIIYQYVGGKLTKVLFDVGFNRKVYWEKPK